MPDLLVLVCLACQAEAGYAGSSLTRVWFVQFMTLFIKNRFKIHFLGKYGLIFDSLNSNMNRFSYQMFTKIDASCSIVSP